MQQPCVRRERSIGSFNFDSDDQNTAAEILKKKKYSSRRWTSALDTTADCSAQTRRKWALSYLNLGHFAVYFQARLLARVGLLGACMHGSVVPHDPTAARSTNARSVPLAFVYLEKKGVAISELGATCMHTFRP